MKPKTRTLLIVVCVAVALAVTLASIYYFANSPSSPTSLPIPAGTVIRGTPSTHAPIAVRFSVAEPSGRFVGRWFADHGGAIHIHWANTTGTPVGGPPTCGASWYGAANVSLAPGDYVMEFSWYLGSNLTVDQTIQVLYPGYFPTANEAYLDSFCYAS